ncbi:MAG: hypothetical protein IJA07_07620 [Agathobacter sp.]|nr:hypothetical protein [Agathobacter sp.]
MEIIDKIIETLLKGTSKARLATIAAFAIFLKMLYDLFGLEYLTMTQDEMALDWGTDVVVGEFLPIDIVTLLIGALVLWLVNYGMKNGSDLLKLGKIARYGTIVIMVLSFTPVPAFCSMIPRMVAGANDNANIYESQKNYEEFAQYVKVSKSIALTGNAHKAEVQSYLQENLTELGKQEVKSIEAEQIRDYIKITIDFNEFGKENLIYAMEVEELDYPTAYYQMKYEGKTVLGCKEELQFKEKLEFEDVVIKYPTMMNYAVIGVDTIYGTAKGVDGFAYEYKMLIDSSSMYKTFAPYLSYNIPNEISALPDYCKDMVYEAARFLPGNGSQTVETSQTLEVNGVQMQRATGVLTGSEYGANGAVTIYRYVAYYFFVEEKGVSYPAVMIAVGNEQIASDVEYYIDQIIQKVSKKGAQSVDATEF